MKEEFTTSARRWYDKDPVLSSAMKTLEESDDETSGPPNGGMGLRQKYESPLLSAAEKLFGATIQRVEKRKKP